MIIKKIISVVLLGVSLTTAKAQSKLLNNSNEVESVSQKVTQLFKENKVHEAFDILKPYWPLPENEIDGMEEQTIKSLNLVSERFGKPEGIIKVNEGLIKDFAIRETYFVKYEKHAIRLIFVYYKNKEGWMLNSFKWDDNFIEEFK